MGRSAETPNNRAARQTSDQGNFESRSQDIHMLTVT